MPHYGAGHPDHIVPSLFRAQTEVNILKIEMEPDVKQTNLFQYAGVPSWRNRRRNRVP